MGAAGEKEKWGGAGRVAAVGDTTINVSAIVTMNLRFVPAHCSNSSGQFKVIALDTWNGFRILTRFN